MYQMLYELVFLGLLAAAVAWLAVYGSKTRRSRLQRDLAADVPKDKQDMDDATRERLKEFEDLYNGSFFWEDCDRGMITKLEDKRNEIEDAVFNYSELSYLDREKYDKINETGTAISAAVEARVQDCRKRAGRPCLINGPMRHPRQSDDAPLPYIQ